MSKVTMPIATDETLQSVVSTLQTVAEKLSEIAADETLQGVAKDTTLAEVAKALQSTEEALKNIAKDETLQQIAKDATLQNAVSTLQSVVEKLSTIATDATLQGVAKDATLKTLASDTSLQAVAKTLGDKDAILTRIAEALDAKDTTKERLSEIEAAAEEKKQEIEAVGEQVKATIPEDYSTLAGKVNNTSNALKGIASDEGAVGISDVSSVEHIMDVRVSSKNVCGVESKNVAGDGAYASGTIVMTLKPNTTYTYSADFEQVGTLSTAGIGVRYITGGNIATTATSSEATGRLSTTFTTPDGGKVVLTMFSNTTANAVVGTSCNFTNIQVEIGATATAYTPYVDVTGVSVNKCGKNLIPYPYSEFTKEKNGITFTDNGDGTVTVNGTATGNSTFIFTDAYELTDGVTYIFSIVNDTLNRGYFTYFDETGTAQFVRAGVPFAWKAEYTNRTIYIEYKSGDVVDNVVIYPQLEVGSTATEYEPYIEPVTYIPNADGTVEGVTSLYPSTTLLTDTAGVIVDAEYNRDINKAFEALVQAIISLGGNV